MSLRGRRSFARSNLLLNWGLLRRKEQERSSQLHKKIPMKILLCDDQAVIRDGLEMLLNLEKDFQVVGAAQDGAEAVELAAQKQPDLILMDLKMPIMNGIEATREIRTKFPNIKILVLTTYDDDEWVFDAIRAGASGYLLKDTPRQKIVEAIRGTMEGKSFVDPAVAGKLLNQVASKQTQPQSILTDKLTERELDVLRLIAKGINNGEIANQLHLSEGTVRNHVSAILEKLGVSDRTQAAVIAIQHGL
jgi:NarL family two-component system response regulator LiaR